MRVVYIGSFGRKHERLFYPVFFRQRNRGLCRAAQIGISPVAGHDAPCGLCGKGQAGNVFGLMPDVVVRQNPAALTGLYHGQSMDGASFPVAAKDMVNLRGRDIGLPYKPSLATPEGLVLEKKKAEMKKDGLIG